MNTKDKDIIMNTVLNGTLKNVQNTLEICKLVKDESFFDYELLKTALRRKHQGIANFLILKKGCRVRNPNKNNLEEETPLHLAMKFNKSCFIQKILIRGASIYDKNQDGETPMYAAFKKGYFCAIEDLLQYCCRLKNLNPKNEDDVLHFHIACITEDLDSVKVYLAAGFDVNRPLSIDSGKYFDLDGHIFSNPIVIYPDMTPLHFATMYGFKDMVQLQLENGADSNKADKKGRTSLHYAILGEFEGLEFGEEDLRRNIIAMLLEKKASLEVADKNGCTPLHMAFNYGKSEEKKNIFEMLLSNIHWRSTNLTDHQGLSYFHIACTTNDVNQVKEYINAGVNINKRVLSGTYSGYTPLHFAVLYNQKNVVELLLKNKAKVNVKTSEMQVAPLHLACEYNYVKFYELNSKFVWAIQNNKIVDLDWLSNCENQLSIIKILLLHGANTEIKDSLGKTPLHHAGTFDFCHHCELDQLRWSESFINILNQKLSIRLREIIEMLLRNKANINSLTNNKSSILHIFSENSFLNISDELIKFLIDKGLDIDAVDNVGWTPLHVAVKADNKQMVQILLKYKANVNAESKSSIIPLEISIKNYLKHSSDKKDIICMLLDNGSHVNIINENGRSLLSAAIAETNVFIVAKLLYYGADINIKDVEGKPSIASLYKWQKTLSERRYVKFATLFQIVFIHIQKLLALGLHVCRKVLKCCNELYPLYKNAVLESEPQLTSLDGIYDDCKQELEEMKLVKIDHYNSLYSILRKDRHALSKHVKNSSFVNIVNDQDIDEKFPLYGYLLKIQFKKGLIRSYVLESSKSSLDYVIGLSLPDSCYDLVIKHLTNEEVANLNAAVPVKRSNDDI